ncbi:hypothetical protein ZHAS_00020183 [Anopheles sinensis]|uniref:Uncharacterized protein n=1 Tax=Anopheles sinensis TaxID=74873 RepID=A0A084WP44_ANOSI|nr:hypothetical protein ZHAS_00020183 [Anopheles sinensis]
MGRRGGNAVKQEENAFDGLHSGDTFTSSVVQPLCNTRKTKPGPKGRIEETIALVQWTASSPQLAWGG